jgi:hypothetical protein
MALDLRAVLTVTEEHPAGGGATQSRYRMAVAAIVVNPLAGRYEEDLGELVKLGEELGRRLSERVLRLTEGAGIGSVGKAAVVGQDGELEHAAALIGSGFDAAVRKAIGGWRATVPSTKKIAGPGAIVEMPLYYLEGVTGPPLAPMEIRVPGHPRDDEAVVVLAVGERTGALADRGEA